MELFWNFLALLGGLAMFLFGMSVMGEGLERRAGERLKGMLGRMTAGRLRGLLLGVAVTAAIQSSSAVTVMVIGFVNSGVMTLRQSIGVIMGANVGTTVTSWLLSLTGIESSNPLIRLLKPSTFVALLGILGVWMYVFSKREHRRAVGEILLGFTVLIYGMEKMSDAVAPLADLPAFGDTLLLFQNPILGVLAGAILTAVIQSSSASVGILQALSVTGRVTYATAIPLIMGQNIGTCATSLLSSVGARKNAKRAALVHLYFNLIGTVVLLGGFYLSDLLFALPFMEQTVSPVAIAVVHTLFNLLSTLLLYPFARALERLVIATVREGDGEGTPRPPLLDQRLLTAPSVAVAHSREVTERMAKSAFDNVRCALGMLFIYKEETMAELEEGESEVDRMEDEIGKYLVALGSKDVSSSDGALAGGLLRIIGDLERISDHAVRIGRSARELFEKRLALSGEDRCEVEVLIEALRELLEHTSECLAGGDPLSAVCVESLGAQVDALQGEIRIRHIERMRQSGGEMVTGFILADLLSEMERISDHCINLAACIADIAEGRTHAEPRDDLPLLRGFYREKYALEPK